MKKSNISKNVEFIKSLIDTQDDLFANSEGFSEDLLKEFSDIKDKVQVFYNKWTPDLVKWESSK